jgi:hypothetical protein
MVMVMGEAWYESPMCLWVAALIVVVMSDDYRPRRKCRG